MKIGWIECGFIIFLFFACVVLPGLLISGIIVSFAHHWSWIYKLVFIGGFVLWIVPQIIKEIRDEKRL